LARELSNLDFKIVTGGTDNHLMLVDLRNKGLTGGRAEKILENVNISVNKNTIPGDVSALNPNGIRIGTPAITTRGLKETDMIYLADIINRVVNIGIKIQTENQIKTIKEFAEYFPKYPELRNIQQEVEKWMSGFAFYT
jgi:glycine hydroxymethyltransferase